MKRRIEVQCLRCKRMVPFAVGLALTLDEEERFRATFICIPCDLDERMAKQTTTPKQSK